MEYERTSMTQFAEIERLIEAGYRNRQISRALRCRRTLIADIRSGKTKRDVIGQAKKPENRMPPGWALRVDWGVVEKDLRGGFQIKRIWDESAAELT